MKRRLGVRSENYAGNDGKQSQVNFGGLCFTGNEEREDGGEERRGGSDRLIKRNRDVTERSVAAHYG